MLLASAFAYALMLLSPLQLNLLLQARLVVEACDLRTLALPAARSGVPYVVLDVVGPGGDGVKLGAG